MPRNCAEATVRSSAPRSVVWDVLTDVSSWKDWGDWDAAALEREGDPPPNGIGAIRLTARGPVRVREQVEVWEPESRFGYTLLSGLPLRDYHSVVTLTDAGGGGTNVHWQSRFDAAWPGTDRLLRYLATKVLRDIAREIAAEAERRGAAARREP